MNGSKQRYAGLKGETDPAKAIGIIKAGGYATDTKYVSKVLSIINKYELTEYDQATKGGVSNLKINQNPNFGTHNTSPRSGEIEYIVIHYVGATGTAKNNIDYYNQRSTTNASADFYVGFEGEKWQYNPDPKARYCWAVGGGKQSSYGGSLYGVARNANSVSIEMCVRNKGTKAPQAAGKIHSDFERGFIRAEVIAYDDLIACGSMTAAKEKGLVRSEGKDYVMKDGDVVLFRFNV